MMKPLTTVQKIIAYSSLVIVIFCTLFGMFIIWLYVSEIILE
jgi:uncharacterized membrane protein